MQLQVLKVIWLELHLEQDRVVLLFVGRKPGNHRRDVLHALDHQGEHFAYKSVARGEPLLTLERLKVHRVEPDPALRLVGKREEVLEHPRIARILGCIAHNSLVVARLFTRPAAR
eukprot:scaffold19217_cov117-Isochrysis_galbana.AAC.3